MRINICSDKTRNFQNKKQNLDNRNCDNKNLSMPSGKSAIYSNKSYLYFQGISNSLKNQQKSRLSKIEGCLIGGAVGDAFGASVEATSLSRIKERYGSQGIKYIPKKNGKYRVTDDTQMTIFTLDGLLKSYCQNKDITKEPDYTIIYDSYKDWYKTQCDFDENQLPTNGLLSNPSLYSKRGPGRTCLSALKQGVPGDVENPINNSYANGGIMRVAPIGVLYSNNPKLAFDIGVKTTALTHGHPNAYLPAGFQASLIAYLMNGNDIDDAILNSLEILKKYDNNDDTCNCILKAMELSKTDIEPTLALKKFNKGIQGSEALGMSLYCVLKNQNNFKKALEMAVNQDGDSDTIGAITGSIIGASVGSERIPRGLLENIEYLPILENYTKVINAILNTEKNSTHSDISSLYARWDDNKFDN